MYEVMRYWDDDLPDWDAEDPSNAACGSCRTLKSVGANAMRVESGGLEAAIRKLKARLDGEIAVEGDQIWREA